MDIAGRAKALVRDQLGAKWAERRPRRPDPVLSEHGLESDDRGLLLHGRPLGDLADEYGSPLHVIDGARLDARLADVAAGPADVYYSYKTNPIPAALERMHRAGIGAEVISAYELWMAHQLGVPAERTIYNGPVKSAESVRGAIHRGILLINANSASEIDVIEAIAADEGRSATVGVRIALPGMWAGQFGIRSLSDEALGAIRTALAAEHLDLKALHFHRGVTMRTRAEYEAYVNDVLAYCDAVTEATGWSPEMLDLGGSLACATVGAIPAIDFRANRAYGTDLLPPSTDDFVSVRGAGESATRMLEQHFGSRGLTVPRAILEPGRALTADTQLLITTVHDVKADGEPWHVIADAGINIAEAVSNEYHGLLHAGDPLGPADRSYRIAGPICTPADVLYNNWRLPEVRTGDRLAILDTGAYCVPFSTTFSFPRPAIVVVDPDGVTVAQDRETFGDMIRRDHFVPLDATNPSAVGAETTGSNEHAATPVDAAS